MRGTAAAIDPPSISCRTNSGPYPPFGPGPRLNLSSSLEERAFAKEPVVPLSSLGAPPELSRKIRNQSFEGGFLLRSTPGHLLPLGPDGDAGSVPPPLTAPQHKAAPPLLPWATRLFHVCGRGLTRPASPPIRPGCRQLSSALPRSFRPLRPRPASWQAPPPPPAPRSGAWAAAAVRASRSGPSPNIGSHIGGNTAAGWTELQRLFSPCPAQ